MNCYIFDSFPFRGRGSEASRFAIPLLVAVWLIVSCTDRVNVEQALPPVILISVDTLRADHLPAHGYRGVRTPALDRFRADSILFSEAYAHCPLTLPSHVSMLTGLLPTDHGVRNNAGYTFDTRQHPSLPLLLRGAGYRTGASVSSYVLRKETGLGPLFDFYDDAMPIRSEAVSVVDHQRSGTVTARAAETWIAQQGQKPFFFFLHLYEPHTPYAPPEPFRSRYSNPYDGEIAQSDAIVGSFLERLRSLGVYDRAIIIFTSDHGEGLDDHGEGQHGILLYRESIHVPLFLKLPRSERGGSTIGTPVAHVDLVPTILELTGLAGPPNLAGASLLSTPDPRRQIYSETYFPLINLGWSPLRSLRTSRFALIDSPRPELYDVLRDRKELNNIIATERRVAADLRKALEQYPAELRPVEAIDPETAARMAALGYIGSARTRTADPQLNPRDQIRLLPRIAEAFRLADQRRYDEAIRMMRELVDANPRMLDIWEKLGTTLADAGRDEEAIAAFQTAMRQTPEVAPALALRVADIHLRNNRIAEAEEHARLALRSDPLHAHTLLARSASTRGDMATAHRELSAAMTAGGRQPSTMVLLAEIQVRQGAHGEALSTLEQAERRAGELRIDKVPRLDFVRGDALARLERLQEAEVAYRREIQHFPDQLQAYANLAVLHVVRGDGDAFDETLRMMIRANPTPRSRRLAARTAEAVGDREGASRWLR